jgi:hypothetical protein
MRAAIGALKYAGYQYIVYAEICPADRTLSLQSSVNTVSAAANVHQAVIAAGYGRKGQSLYQIAPVQFCGTYRAGLKIAGRFLPCFLEQVAAYLQFCPVPHEKAETKRQQCDANNNESQYL